MQGRLNTKILVLFILISSLLVNNAEATDYTSSNFILRDPIVTVSGGRSTASSFEFFSATSQIASIESTSSSFKYKAGFLYFEESATTTTTSTGTGSVSGGDGAAPRSKAIFSGKAYPGATVILLKDAQITATVLANENADFTIELSNLSPIDYIFSIYAKDYASKASRLILIPVKLVSGLTTAINNILIPPTISKDKKEVRRGENIDIFGQSLPSSSIEITVETPTGRFSVKTFSDSQGKYKYSLDTSSLDFGQYKGYLQASFGKVISISSFVSFIVGDETILEEITVCPLQADLNSDCAVNLIDFSILIYWFDHANVPSRIDLSGDGIADLVDFSIMAYYWTG